MGSNDNTYSVLLFKSGTFVRQVGGLTRREAMSFADEACREGEATRAELWDEYHDQLYVALGR